MIVVALAVFMCHQDGQKVKEPPKTLFETCIKVPTGNSAFEDYLRAADAINTDEFDALSNVVTDIQMNPYRELPGRLPDWARGKSLLDVDRIRTRKFESAFKWIEDGNRKPLNIPPELLLPQEGEPWIDRFRNLARLSGAMARVHFADSDPSGATTLIIDNLLFASNIRPANANYDFVGINCERHSFSVLNSNLTNLGESDWERLLEAVHGILNEPTPMISVLTLEKQQIVSDLHTSIQTCLEFQPDPREPKEYNDQSLAVKNALIALSPTERESQEAEAVAWAIEQTEKTIETLRLPEYKWPLPGDPWPPAPKTVYGKFVELHPTDLVDDCRIEMRDRTQLRLLVVNGLIQLFRLRNGRLPLNLGELSAPEAVKDQLTGKDYVYELNGRLGQYQVYSPGRGDLGRIDMRWIREYKNRKEEAGLDPDKP